MVPFASVVPFVQSKSTFRPNVLPPDPGYSRIPTSARPVARPFAVRSCSFSCLDVAFDSFTLGITVHLRLYCTLLYVKQGRVVILCWVLDMFRVLLRVLICCVMQGRVSEVSQAFHVSRACECFRVFDCAG